MNRKNGGETILVRCKHYSKFVTRKFALKMEEIVDEFLVEKIAKQYLILSKITIGLIE